MLIIAMPKSASTSLMITLGELHKIKSTQDFSIKSNNIPVASNIIHTVHSDIREILPDNVKTFNDKSTFYKQHIFPSENNLKLLENVKKVILLRNPEDVLYAYIRGAKNKHNSLPKGYEIQGLTEKKILKKAKTDGFFDDICFFGNEWINKGNPDNTLIVNYEDYIVNAKEVINKIESFFGLPITKEEIEPAKARYSRDNKAKQKIEKIAVIALDKLGIKDMVKQLLKRK